MYTFLYVSAENKVFLTFKDQISPLLQKNPADWRDSLLLHVVSLLHIVDHLHELLAEVVGLLHGLSLAVDADDGLSVRLAQVNPTVGEVDLHTVDVVDRGTVVLGEHLLHLHQDGVDIGLGCEVDAVLRNLVVGVHAAQFTDGAALLCQTGEEEGDTYEGVAAVVALGIDDAAVAFAADDGSHLLHLRGDVDLTDGSGEILTAVTLGDVAQGTGATQIRDGGH